MPILALLPSLFELISKFVGNTISSPSLMSVILNELHDSPTGASIVSAIEKALGPLEAEKKQQFILEVDSLLGQIQLNAIAEQKHFITPRDFLFWGLVISLLLSVLVEPTVNYGLGLFGYSHIPTIFMFSPLIITMVAGLCGLHVGLDSFEKSNR